MIVCLIKAVKDFIDYSSTVVDEIQILFHGENDLF